MNTKNQIIIVVVIIASVTVGIVLVMQLNALNENMNNVFSGSSGSSSMPTHDQLRQMCHDKLVDLQGSEPSEMQMDICVGTVTEHFNK